MAKGDDYQLALTVRDACLQAAIDAYERAGMSGLCGEGRWEMAIQAIRALDLRPVIAEIEGVRRSEP
ncbi:MAG: acetyltransferase [Chromatiaceae bacterium]|jgi:hypothetical protein